MSTTRFVSRRMALPLCAFLLFFAPAARALDIYTDALAAGWSDWSWSATNNFSNTSPVHAGAHSVASTFTAGWAGLSLYSATLLNQSNFTNLRFWIHGGSGGANTLAIFLENSPGTTGPHFIITVQPNAWQEFVIPMSNLGNIGNFNRVNFHSQSASPMPTMYYDDIVLTSNGNPPPPPPTVNHIMVDQFGYPQTGQKIAVIASQQTGYNAPANFTPGNTYQVRRTSDNVVVFSGAPTAWGGGATHGQSGDKAWWFDFSALATPGEYVVHDPTNNVNSYAFSIGDAAYANTMKQAVRSFYYQRCGAAKPAANAGAGWADAVCHNHALQDLDCRAVATPTNASTAKNLSGGWHDAGDYNKYVPYAERPIHDLLTAYLENPSVFTDDYNIPESGNGIPDLLDEVKYELDWLLKMQNTNGSVHHKVSVACYQSASPPSADNAQRMYGPVSTTATLVNAKAFAHAAIAFYALNTPATDAYANTLKAAAIKAWNWANANGNVIFNNTGFCSVGIESDAYERTARKISAAAYLAVLTNTSAYKTFFESNYTQLHLFAWNFAYPFESIYQDAALFYRKSNTATAAVRTNVGNVYKNAVLTGADNLPAFTAQTDAYRAFLTDGNHVWGSNAAKTNAGNLFMNMNLYGLDNASAVNTRNAASGYLHYMHGVNPNDFVFLSNMGAHGAERSINEFYHSWFADGSPLWDRVGTSTYGPAPGFVPGGPNPSFVPAAGYIAPPQGQPVQKSYKDWNAGYPENSWEITENAVGYQGTYVRLLSKFMGNLPACANPANAWATEIGTTKAKVNWSLVPLATQFQLRYKQSTATTWTTKNAYCSFFYLMGLASGKTYQYEIRTLCNGAWTTWTATRTFATPAVLSADEATEARTEFSAPSIFPNPASDQLNIEWRPETETSARLTLADQAGRIVLDRTLQVSPDNETIVLEIGALPDGLYFLRIESPGQSWSEKVQIWRK